MNIEENNLYEIQCLGTHTVQAVSKWYYYYLLVSFT